METMKGLRKSGIKIGKNNREEFKGEEMYALIHLFLLVWMWDGYVGGKS